VAVKTALGKTDPTFDTAGLEVNDWGMVNLPLVPSQVDGMIGEASDKSYYHFKGAEPGDSDDCTNPDSLCAFTRLAKDWKKRCGDPTDSRCAIQVGNVSFFTPALEGNTIHDPLGHEFHYHGTCFDVRAMRKDGKYGRMSLADETKEFYDLEKTKEFISFLISNGATPTYFTTQIGMQSLGCLKPGSQDPKELKKLKSLLKNADPATKEILTAYDH
jgi:hypothetical protein